MRKCSLFYLIDKTNVLLIKNCFLNKSIYYQVTVSLVFLYLETHALTNGQKRTSLHGST